MNQTSQRQRRGSLGQLRSRTVGLLAVVGIALTSGVVAGASAQAASRNELVVTRLFDGTAGFTANNAANPVNNDGVAPAPHTPGQDSGATNNVVRTNDLYSIRIDWDINEADATNVVIKATLPPISTWAPDETGMFSGCDPAKSTIVDLELTCWIGDKITQGSHGAIRPIATLNRDAVNNTTFNVKATLITGEDTTGISNQLKTPLTVSEAPVGDWVKYKPEIKLINDSNGNPAWYVMLYPMALIDYSQRPVPQKGAGRLDTSKPIQFFDHAWKLAPGTIWATPADLIAAGFAGNRVGPYAQGGPLPETAGDWTVANVTQATSYYVYQVDITNYTDVIKPTNADGSPNKDGVILAGQLGIKMPYKNVQADIDPVTQGVQYYNTIGSNPPSDDLNKPGAIVKPIQILGSTATDETTVQNNTSDTAISNSTSAGGASSGSAQFHMANIAPTATTVQQARIIDETRTVSGGIPRVSTTDVGYFGKSYYDGRGEVTRGTPVDLEMFVSTITTGKETIPIHGCMTWDPQQLYVTPMHDFVDWHYNPNGNTYSSTPPNGYLEDTRLGTSGGSWARGSYARPTTYELPAPIADDIGLVVEYAYDPSVYSDDQTNGQAECNNKASRKWIASTDLAGIESNFRDSSVPFTRYKINMVRLRTKYFPWERLYEGGQITTPLNHQTSAGIFLSLSAMVGIDKDINYTGKSVYVHSGRASGTWNAIPNNNPLTPYSDKPQTKGCWPAPDHDDVTLDWKLTGWCSQPYSVNNEDTGPSATSTLDKSNFQDVAAVQIDSDTDRVTIIDVKPVVTKTNRDGVFDIADNDQTVQFDFKVQAVGAKTEALTDVTLTDQLPANYEFVEFVKQPTVSPDIAANAPACEFDPSTGPQGTIRCRFSEEPGTGPVPADVTDLPEALPGLWEDSFSILVKVQGAVSSPTSYRPLVNTATMASEGFAPWDAVNGTFLTPTIPATELHQESVSQARSYMPFAGDYAISGKTVDVSGGTCVTNLLPGELTLAEWQERCALIPLDTDPSNTTATDSDGNIKFALNYTNEGNTLLTDVSFVDVLPFIGDDTDPEPASSSKDFGANPPTFGDGRSPGSKFSGKVGLVSAAMAPGSTSNMTAQYWTNADPATISRDPLASWTTVTWCDSAGTPVNAVAGTCPANPYEITGVYMVVDKLYPDASLSIDLTIDTEGAACTDSYTNTAGARNAQMFLPVRTNDVSAMIGCEFDLALQKRLSKTFDPKADPTWATAGTTKIPFEIEVINQGDPVNGISLVDYVDTSVFSFDLADNPPGKTVAGALGTAGTGPTLDYTWAAADPAKPTVELTGALPVGQSVILPVVLTLEALPDAPLTNYSEIFRFDDDGDASNGDSSKPNADGFLITDIDSTPDELNNEPAEGKLINNVIDNFGGDEDDHDISLVPWYDLALVKDLADGQKPVLDTTKSPVTVNYVIIMKNQGPLTAKSVLITDTPATGFTYASSNTSGAVDIGGIGVTYNGVSGGVATFTVDSLAPGEEITIPVTYDVDLALATTGDYRNAAEITSFTDEAGVTQPDVDSLPDAIPDNDAYTDPETPQPEHDGGESPDFLPPGYTNLHARNPLDEDDADFEFVSLPYSLGNQVWFDPNNNGLIDAGEAPAPGVAVELYTDANADGEPDQATPIQTDTTDADGLYLFEELPVGNYVVVIPASNFATGAPLFSTESSTPTETDPNLDVDGNDDGIATPTDVRSGTVTLGGDEPLGENPNNDPNADVLSNLTVDFGFLPVNFDLALRKTPSADTPDLVVVGDKVTFDITVFNQGTVDGADIIITDYLPAGLTLDDPEWTDKGDGTASYNTPLSIAAGGEPQVITITFTVDVPGKIDNYSEIRAQTPVDSSGAELTTPGGNPVVDVDSTPDNINNEPGDGWLIDDEINFTRAQGDEDDHDIASINTYPRFDLALRKTLAPGQDAKVSVGDVVPFQIEVFNQGSTWATSIEVVDYIPDGLVFATDNPGWSPSSDGTTATKLLLDSAGAPLKLAPGASTTIIINLIANQQGNKDNYSEISLQTAIDEQGTVLTGPDGNPLLDVDSTPDTINNEPGDGWLIDNEINFTRAQGDEDDHDIARVAVDVPIYDLALRKTPAPGQSLQVARGDKAKFAIEIFNQGDLKTDQITITDYIPAQLKLNDPNWTDNGDGTGTYKSLLTLDVGATETIFVTFDVVLAGKIDNYSEISAARPLAPDGSVAVDENGKVLTDIDSVPDTILGNDVLVDDVIDNSGGDEDDEDIASLFAAEYKFDLALRKTIQDAPSPLALGDIVTFKIEVFNQGNVPATDIKIVDYIPPQMDFVTQSGWTTPVGKKTTRMIAGTLNPGKSTSITIKLKVRQPADPINNYSEIAANTPTFDGGKTVATDSKGRVLKDIDSTPDMINNEPGDNWLIDNEINFTRAQGDEDDHDIASIKVPVPVFDLALRKTPSQGQAENVRVGDLVNFDITIFNQGTIAANGITITDYIPSELSLTDGDWTNNGNGKASFKVPGTLEVGKTFTVQVTFRVLKTGDIDNYSEISTQTAIGPDGQVVVDNDKKKLTDVDSTPDAINNEPGDNWLIDNEINFTRAQGDEDDHDIASLKSIPFVFDLALRKTIATANPSPVKEGDVVTFDIELFNQGEVIARDINVIDYIPEQMELADTTWKAGAGRTATTVVPGPLLPGQSTVIQIKLRVVTAADIANHSEIFGARPTDQNGNTLTTNDGKPLPDVDSTPDTILGNDKEIDDEINKTPATGDEDDEDIATLTPENPVFDLALRKLLTSNPVVAVNDLATYSIEVFNQGEVEARDVTVVDYLPAGMVLEDPKWTAGPNNTASYTIAGPIKPLSSVVITVTVRITNTANITSFTNQSEITKARPTDKDGKTLDIKDIDSVYDENPNNDKLIDNEINRTPETGDEDDEDIAIVQVDQTIPETGAESQTTLRLAALLAAAGLGLVALAGRRRRYRLR